ncbi:nucleotidyltransferase family protein [Rhodomicrobium sp. Az07]|uniref:nucleotidyltransferase family protein n=1 Tax=Rhodomicrobium sp. Az07 TaxID=2839034 RepID=UPI0020369580|nr:nucleotidyltransferase family protein [Rhodomicrobium sp. Az07]
MRLLEKVQALHLPDCWIGAGFVRAAVWDYLHGRLATAPTDDVDVIWFDRKRAAATVDSEIEAQLKAVEPSIDWSVKNQARMHLRNGDEPYISAKDAVSRWPETATAIALRLTDRSVEIMAPFGIDDLFSLTVRPTPAFIGEKLPIFRRRVQEKRWLERWPRLILASEFAA